MNWIKVAFGQFGTSNERHDALALLIEIDDLPRGDWKVGSELAWPIKPEDSSSESAFHNTRVGAFTAFRIFTSKTSLRSLLVEVTPFMSSVDAKMAAPRVHRRSGRNKSSKLKVTEERMITEQNFLGVIGACISERKTIGADGPGTAWCIVGNVEEFLFVVMPSGANGEWSSDEAFSLATLQVIKIRNMLDERANHG